MNINRVLGYLATTSAALAFLLWALPFYCFGEACGFGGDGASWFYMYNEAYGRWSGEAQWVLVFAVASVVLLIARAGNRR